ncbi:hypothetical protein D6D12_01339 [Aureobasidium pullulans]|uniref:BTB domain-containing protein n=1 Tax=Aureobasidium pullulans TaxID=5580 RepID=A0AB74K4P7_AURPU|nr:hypothetical protein D6D11_10199 [Aureobasidium pullulans]THX33740.1 hypothetical protein D6D12_01339 [Aureobasidium pullulans]
MLLVIDTARQETAQRITCIIFDSTSGRSEAPLFLDVSDFEDLRTMADHSSSVFHSRLFTFHAGENGASATVHSGAVAAISTPLKLLMEEETPDGPRTSAILEGVREEDLLRFCDFCYTSTYTDPYPVVIKQSSTPAPDTSNGKGTSTALVPTTDETTLQPPAAKRLRTESPARLTGFGRPSLLGTPVTPDATTASKLNNKLLLHSVFANTSTSVRVFGAVKPKIFTVSSNDNHTSVFIAHAAMYSLAIRYDITKLKALSLQKLSDKLMRFECEAERVGDVMALVRYVYETERTMTRDMQDLRDVVTRYVVSEVSEFGNSEEFGALLEEGGLFVKDFWSLIYSTLL